ncbi:hypothetical protein CsatB_027556 [Cannabis sativa]
MNDKLNNSAQYNQLRSSGEKIITSNSLSKNKFDDNYELGLNLAIFTIARSYLRTRTSNLN